MMAKYLAILFLSCIFITILAKILLFAYFRTQF